METNLRLEGSPEAAEGEEDTELDGECSAGAPDDSDTATQERGQEHLAADRWGDLVMSVASDLAEELGAEAVGDELTCTSSPGRRTANEADAHVSGGRT